MSQSSPTPQNFAIEDAWKPLPGGFWRIEEAQHFLRRVGFSASPEAVTSALRGSPKAYLQQAFRPDSGMQRSDALKEFTANIHQRYQHIYREVEDEEEKRKLRQEIQREENELFRGFAMDWFYYARQPQQSAREKFVVFLQDIFVVEQNKVRDTELLFSLQQTLREGTTNSYPELCKKISREPAMVRYLDLLQNTARKPNENFARELFELFTLGEGNYTETDIKEAARAFTGYRIKKRREFYQEQRLHDDSKKTIFGETGKWNGDDVVDITFRQPAAKTFLIRELIKFYLTEEVVPEPYIQALGEQWAEHNFSLSYLIETFFQSRLFFHPAYRGNMVKSPLHFYIGLCQDLRIDIAPFEARVLRSMATMGQSFYNPPNVRGWLYGEHWINSTTISARRQLVDYIFAKLDEENLNANEQRDLEAAREAGRGNFLVTQERLQQVLSLAADDLATHLTTYFITAPSRATYRNALQSILGNTQDEGAAKRVRYAIIALLQSPAYNLC
ncbi:DUF1800 family protein [Coraliomargarita sp. SDUM461004]|uniref:DUF1800 family protein n=1 Tax=Thalassobacterium sedimentorum TaxID=3041258 RepID=A0ABU1AEE2_9BACT|nr:DUF1800 family protein [Coraliomargarita sp. SDUM461004]MDQ8193142.1 DUF1800 family protein [Coraliomargarita sp. SDUM461004]